MAVEIRSSGEAVTVRSEAQSVTASTQEYAVEVTSAVIVGGIPYSGSYSATPSEVAQTLPTASRMLNANITIDPIPSNYGRLLWDGTILTVY